MTTTRLGDVDIIISKTGKEYRREDVVLFVTADNPFIKVKTKDGILQTVWL